MCLIISLINGSIIIITILNIFSEHSDADSSDKIRPYFEEPLHSISVPLGQDAVFKCIAKGNPMPAFKWYSFELCL